MYKESWGHKRICPCGKITYYDLGRLELECPTCGKQIEVTNLAKPRRGRKPGTSNALNINIANIKATPETKPDEVIETNEELEIETVEGDENVEDDTVLIEEDNEIDPMIGVGIKPNDNKEDQ